MKTPGRYPLELKSYELDHKGTMPVWVIYRFLQEAAEMNAVDLGFDTETLLNRSLTWMLARLQLRCAEPPAGRSRITAETWPSGIESRFALRDFRLWLNGAETPFAVAKSYWLLIDINRMRPVTVSNILGPEHVIDEQHTVDAPFPSLQSQGTPAFTAEFRVRRSDLDMNDHVNNVHYVEWLAEAVPEEVWRGNRIAELDVEYKRAVQFGDTVRIDSHEAGPGAYIHTMSAGGAVVVSARSVWTAHE
jgi:medium-chain acyl-[acyl-carrier-protein] hydrolase